MLESSLGCRSLCNGGMFCINYSISASLPPPHLTPQSVATKMSPEIAKCLLGMKFPTVESQFVSRGVFVLRDFHMPPTPSLVIHLESRVSQCPHRAGSVELHVFISNVLPVLAWAQVTAMYHASLCLISARGPPTLWRQQWSMLGRENGDQKLQRHW